MGSDTDNSAVTVWIEKAGLWLYKLKPANCLCAVR